MSSKFNEEDSANRSSSKKQRLSHSSSDVREIKENESIETSSSVSVNQKAPGDARSSDKSSGSSVNTVTKSLNFDARLTLNASSSSVELAETQVPQSSGSGEGPSDGSTIPSSAGSNIFSPEVESGQVGPEEAVKYGYILKKQLADVDVSSGTIRVLKAEAEKHFPPLRATGQYGNLRVYDIDRKKRLDLGFGRIGDSYCISRTLTRYINDNKLQAGDSVLFYKTESDQKVNDKPPPRYAVHFEKFGESVDTGVVNIGVDELASAKKIGYSSDESASEEEKSEDSKNGSGGSTLAQN